MKLCLVSSRGGHLYQLYRLKKWWNCYEHFWVTGKGEDTKYFLKNEKVFYAHFPESRNIVNALRNTFLAFKILVKEKPDLIVSCGAGVALPFFYAGKIIGCKLIFIEPYDFVAYPSLTGKLVAPIVNELLVQHSSQKKFYKSSKYWGKTLL